MTSRNIIVTILIIALALSVLLSGCLKPEAPTHEQGIPVVDLTNQSENIKRLTINPGPDENLLWSVDGKRIFFESRPDIGVGRYGPECYICVMDVDGSNLTRLASGTYLFITAVCTDKVFFQYEYYPGIDLGVMNTNGSNKKKLTSLNVAPLGYNPTINPEGEKICYFIPYGTDYYWVKWKDETWTRFDYEPRVDRRNMDILARETHADIFVMDVNGGNKTKIASDIDLTCSGYSDLIWSPNGKKILFQTSTLSSNNPIENFDIRIMDADGSNKVVLLSVPCDPSRVGMGLAWSPDGTKIAFEYHMIDAVNSDIYVIEVQNRK